MTQGQGGVKIKELETLEEVKVFLDENKGQGSFGVFDNNVNCMINLDAVDSLLSNKIMK